MNNLRLERTFIASETAAEAFDLAKSKRPLDRLTGLKILERLADTDHPHTFQGFMDQWNDRAVSILDAARKSADEPVKRQAQLLESSLANAITRYDTWYASQLGPQPQARMRFAENTLS